MIKLFLLIPIKLISLYMLAQLPCSKPVYRQFDFWIGEWEVFNLKGQKAGDSKISLVLDSCTVLEEWTSTNIQKGLRFAGKSFNSFNSARQKWQQYWIDNTGIITAYFDGHFDNGRMILQTENVKVNDSTQQIQKMTFYDLGPGKVRQHGENSNDGGKTWTTSFDLEYRKIK